MNPNYWNNEGATKTFTHELLQEWIEDIPLETNVLDFGCGYGRITRQLYDRGYKNIVGYDPSSTMISRAIVENFGPQYTSNVEDISQYSYGLVICFALFTSCPEPKAQDEIKKIIEEHTQIQSYLYISDYLTSINPHYSEKYLQRQLGIYGCFGSKETVIFRHHNDDHFSKLFSAWRQIYSRNIEGKTLNGNIINITQLLYKKVNQAPH